MRGLGAREHSPEPLTSAGSNLYLILDIAPSSKRTGQPSSCTRRNLEEDNLEEEYRDERIPPSRGKSCAQIWPSFCILPLGRRRPQAAPSGLFAGVKTSVFSFASIAFAAAVHFLQSRRPMATSLGMMILRPYVSFRGSLLVFLPLQAYMGRITVESWCQAATPAPQDRVDPLRAAAPVHMGVCSSEPCRNCNGASGPCSRRSKCRPRLSSGAAWSLASASLPF